MTVTAYIALGSNLGDRAGHISAATKALGELPNSSIHACSPWYQSIAIGPGQQPDYINAVVAITTRLEPLPLLAKLHAIEAGRGRTRGLRWGPRSLDLDLLLYGSRVIQHPELTVPHPRLTERNFVIYPLADIAPSLILPNGVSLKELLAKTTSAGIVRLSTTDGEVSDG